MISSMSRGVPRPASSSAMPSSIAAFNEERVSIRSSNSYAILLLCRLGQGGSFRQG